MDSSEARLSELRTEALCWRYDLSATAAFITRDNINDLVTAEGFDGPLGLLSIDVDGNDYWIWEAIDRVEPAIVVCEYNSILGDVRPISIPYNPDFRRFSAEPSGLYFGCSISALRRLAGDKGYTFVGTNSNGVNAFFVRNDLAKGVLNNIRRPVAFPSRHRDSRDAEGRLTFTRGQDRLRLIEDLPVVDVSTGETLRLRDIGRPYSDEWVAGMG
jgi:hypothetical protein